MDSAKENKYKGKELKENLSQRRFLSKDPELVGKAEH